MERANQFSPSKLLDNIYLLGVAVYLFYLVQSTTTFFLLLPVQTERFLLYLLASLTIIRLVGYFILCQDKLEKNKRLGLALMVCMFVAVALYFMNYYKGGYRFFLFIALLTVGCVGIYYEKIIRLYVIVTGTVVLAAILCACSGGIINYVYLKEGNIRSSWGICYPTDFSAYFVYLTLLVWIGWKKITGDIAIVIGLLSFIISLLVARSSTGVICSLLFIIIVVLQKVIKEHSVLQKVIDRALCLSFPLFSVGMIGLMFAYRKGLSFAYKVNDLLSSRLSLASAAYENHGVSLFGCAFEQIGSGFSTIANPNYNFIDSTYLLILIRYGVILLATYMIVWTAMTHKALRLGDRRLAYGMALIAFHSVSEHHFTEINFNILLILPIVIMMTHARNEKTRVEKKALSSMKEYISHDHAGLARKLSGHICIICLVITTVICLPRLFSVARTVFSVSGVMNTSKGRVCVCVAEVAIVALFAGLCRSVHHLALGRCVGGSKRWCCGYVILCVIFAAGFLWKCERMIDAAAPTFEEIIQADKKALQIVNENKTGKLYIQDVPELYQKKMDGISSSLFSGDELARYTNTSVLMDAAYDSACFSRMGFLYVQISDQHALYSNDKAVIDSLMDNGYHVTGFFSKVLQVDIDTEAVLNSLDKTDDGALILQGPQHSLIYGPYVDLRAGVFTSTYELGIPEDGFDSEKDEDRLICTLRISAFWGQNVVKEVPVFRSNFDENLRYTAQVKCNLDDSQGAEFLAFAEEGEKVYIHQISYAKTPENDTHVFYGDKGRKIKEEYYDLEGNPVINGSGYAACSFGYDKAGNINIYRYLDVKGEPVDCYDGYAILRKTFNEKHQAVKDEYFGVDDRLCIRAGGYAILEREYDSVGNEIKLCFYDTEKCATICASGYAQVIRIYDDSKRMVREECYGTDGRLLTTQAGQAITEFEYDDCGNQIYVRYYDLDERPVMAWGSRHAVHRIFNGNKQMVREEYLDTEGALTTLSDGQAYHEIEYDNNGNASILRYYDAEGNPVVLTAGYAQLHREYNEKKQVIRDEYLGPDGEPVTLPSGHVSVNYDYDDAGNEIKTSYCDISGKLITISSGYAIIRRTFNERKLVICEEYCDENGNLISSSAGYAVCKKEYDTAGNVTGFSYYGVDNRPVTTINGVARLCRSYDEGRRIVKEECYGLDGELVVCTNGYAMLENEYDRKGNLIRQVFYDEKGNIVTKD